MKIITLPVGMLQTNCYLLCDEENKACAIIDPGAEGARLAQAVVNSGCELTAIFLTHGHYDHFLGLEELLSHYPDTPVYIHKADTCGPVTTRYPTQFPRLSERNQRYYQEGDVLNVGALAITVMETPGHSKGSVCLVVGDTIFCGDTLFFGSCGRTDLLGGSYEEILASLKRLGQMEGDRRCLCGHDRETTLAMERRQNPYMKLGMMQ